MIVIGIISQKGGAGKTTLAIHLAGAAHAAGYATCLVDTDPQATAAAWGDWRSGEDPEVITAPATRLQQTLEKLEKAGAELVVIDTPPHADAAAREAARAASVILIPCRPRAFDLHAIQTTADLASFSGRKAFVVFNAAPARAPTLFNEVSELVTAMGLRVAPVMIADRAAFHHSTGSGKTALEVEPRGKAADEVLSLWTWLCEHVIMIPRKHAGVIS